MVYLKSFLVGAAAFLATAIVASTAATAIMFRYPQLAVRIFPAQKFDLQWGSYYSVNFPLWQIVTVGLLAFVIAFAWFIRRASARQP